MSEEEAEGLLSPRRSQSTVSNYSNGNLRVKVKIGVFSYPGKSLIGNVDKTLTKEGVSSGDKSSEDQLMDLTAGRASEDFAQNASAFL